MFAVLVCFMTHFHAVFALAKPFSMRGFFTQFSLWPNRFEHAVMSEFFGATCNDLRSKQATLSTECAVCFLTRPWVRAVPPVG